jgi:hypothetical protein
MALSTLINPLFGRGSITTGAASYDMLALSGLSDPCSASQVRRNADLMICQLGEILRRPHDISDGVNFNQRIFVTRRMKSGD